ncbi:adhesion G protein-coupled receptor E1-like [Mantella aurantiaca]
MAASRVSELAALGAAEPITTFFEDREAKDNFKQLVEIFSQELVSNKHIAKNAQRGKFITAFLNSVERFVLTSFLETPRVQHLNTPELDGAIFITYNEFNFTSNGSYPQTGNKVVINSKVVTGAITNSDSKNLSCPITFRLFHLQPLKPFDKPICVLWDRAKNEWSDKGCETGQSNGTYTNCYCTQLSSFVLLMTMNGIQEVQEEFQQAAEKLSQALAVINLIAENGQRGKFITIFLNTVERVVLLSFLEAPRVQHINTPELDGAIFITYKVFHFNFNGSYPQTDNKVVINSKVVTGAITNPYSKRLNFPITFRLSHLQPLKPFDKSICVFWDSVKNDWSDKGCETGQSNGTYTNCSCTHLSSFALLMAVNGIQVDFTLNILSYFGLSISVICLGLSLLTFILCRSLRSAHTTVLTALCVCLFLGQLLFMVGIHQTWNRLLCALIAGWLQFLFLCAFCWMTVESVLLFMTVQNLRAVNYMASRKSNFPFLCLLGFGVPAVIVGISAAVRPHQYGTEKNCWLSPGIVWSFIGPVSAFITINTILLVLTLWLLKKRISSLNANVSTLKDTRVLTFKAVAQLFILGCTWGIGYFQFGRLSLVISYLFTICNSLQGAFIFLVHCLLNQQVREEYSKLFYRLCTHKKQDMSTISTLQTASKPPLAASTDSNCDCEPTQPAVLNKNVVSADNSPAEKKEQSL